MLRSDAHLCGQAHWIYYPKEEKESRKDKNIIATDSLELEN